VAKNKNDETYLKLEPQCFSLSFAAFSSFLLLQKERPTLYIIGDSTEEHTIVRNADGAKRSPTFLITTQLRISNQAMAERSTRTFIKEKRWDKKNEHFNERDYVIMQFGHNEGSNRDTSKAGYRGVLKGTEMTTVELTCPTVPKKLYTLTVGTFVNL